jgi:hypothetical protein
VRSVCYLGDFKVDSEHRDQLDAIIARFRSPHAPKKLAAPGVDPGHAGPAQGRSRWSRHSGRDDGRRRDPRSERRAPIRRRAVAGGIRTGLLGRRLVRLFEAPVASRVDPHPDEPGS